MAKTNAAFSLDNGVTWKEVELETVAAEQPLAIESLDQCTFLVLGSLLPESVQAVKEQLEQLLDRTTELLTVSDGRVPAVSMTTREYKQWGEQLLAVRTFKSTINNGRLELTRPIDALKQRLMDRVRPFTDGCDSIERNILEAMKLWNAEQRRRDQEQAIQRQMALTATREQSAINTARQLEEQRRPEAAQRVIEQAAKMPPPPAIVSSIPTLPGVSFKGRWSFEIENPNLLPREYLMPDLKKIKARVESFGLQHAVPGLLVWFDEDSSTTVRTTGRRTP